MSSLSPEDQDMAEEKPQTVLVRWEGNQSKRYDNTEEEIWLSGIVAVNKTAVVQPSLDQLCVGDHIEYEFVAKKGKVQLWRGVLVSIDPDAERRAPSTGGSHPVSAEYCTGSGLKEAETTTKGASRLPSSGTDRRVVKSLFEGLSSSKGKRQKRLSTSPLPGGGPKRKRGAGGDILFVSKDKTDSGAKIGAGLPPSEDRLNAISSELRNIKKTPTLGAGLPSSCSLKTISSELKELKKIQREQSQQSQSQLQHYLELQETQLQHYLELQETQSMELQEMKASLLSLGRTVEKLTDQAHAGLVKDDAIDVDSLLSSFSSNPPPSESSFTSLPQAFGSPPPSYSFGVTSPGYHPMIPSLSGKQMRASSVPSTYRYFEQDYRGGNRGASCSLEDDNPQKSIGLFELECGEPLPPSTSEETLVPPFDEGMPSQDEAMPSQDEALYQPVGIGMPSQIPTRLTNKFTPISPTKYKSSDEVISLYKFYKNAKDIGKLAIALAKYTYFGPTTMSQCTVTGRGETTPLDPIKMGLLRGNIRAIFPQMVMTSSVKQFGRSAESLLREPARVYELLPDMCELECHHTLHPVTLPSHTPSCDF